LPADLDGTLAALADPSRRAVVDLLRVEPLCASALAVALGVSRPAMSRHLRVLRQAGVIELEAVDDDARMRMARLRHERFAELRAWLDEVEGFWTGQLDAFKSHVERTKRRPR
jgi:DNA-binding transcriptional ArsR family regulator